VGSGFSDEDVNDLSARLARMEIEKPAVKVPKIEKGTWVEASLVCEVEYASKTRDGMLREPVFIRLRPDL
jgi:bifunctional non-homologous end joining protein LigD